jgi:hypothetical protein
VLAGNVLRSGFMSIKDEKIIANLEIELRFLPDYVMVVQDEEVSAASINIDAEDISQPIPEWSE